MGVGCNGWCVLSSSPLFLLLFSFTSSPHFAFVSLDYCGNHWMCFVCAALVVGGHTASEAVSLEMRELLGFATSHHASCSLELFIIFAGIFLIESGVSRIIRMSAPAWW